MKIAILDDNIHLAKNIEKFFIKSGNEVEIFLSRKDFMEIKDFNHDIYILDINLEDGNGLDVARYLRSAIETPAPILMISGNQELHTKLEGFRIGIDDYIVKPFSPLELEARIKSIMKKVQPLMKKNIRYKNIIFDNEQRQILIDGQEVELSKKEKQIIEYFMYHQDIFVSKQSLINFIWGENTQQEKIANTLNVSICKIRKKLGSDFCLDTINSEGYILRNEPEQNKRITLDNIISHGL